MLRTLLIVLGAILAIIVLIKVVGVLLKVAAFGVLVLLLLGAWFLLRRR